MPRMKSLDTSSTLHSLAKVSGAGKISFLMYLEMVCGDTPTSFAISFCGIPLSAIHSRSQI